MLEQYFKRPAILRCHQEGILGPYLDSFTASLAKQGYARSTVGHHLVSLTEFGRWLVQNGVGIAELDERVIDAFLDECRGQGQVRKGAPSIIRRFLEQLRNKAVVDSPGLPLEESPLAQLESRYENYLRTERGLVQNTIDGYRPFVHRFLVDRFKDGPMLLQKLGPPDVLSFILRTTDSMSCKRTKLMVTSLRSFFHFLLKHGEIETDLAATVPTVTDWQLCTIPKYLPAEQVEGLLDSCDRNTSTGRRDYAILLLLARLGLRASEVVALELDDINWRTGEIMVRGKGLCHDRLPLLPDVGEALATYIRADRPESPTRRLFLRTRAPCRGLANASVVSTIVRRALERAKIDSPQKGAHLLRHSLATRMLRNGASMSEIGEVLRHRSPSSTEIYAKVDIEGLRSLAPSWPITGGGL
jgi:site-specific recombinase XerD